MSRAGMRKSDILGMGLMVFAFFLGAGNLIFPPWAGQQAGENLWLALIGFLATDVGLSLLAIIAIAMVGSPESLTRDIPGVLAPLFWIAVYIIIGPAFAVPRTSIVAYEVGVLPWISQSSSLYLALYSLLFFSVALCLCINPGKLVNIVGKVLAPVLAAVLAALYMAMLLQAPAEFGEGVGQWKEHAMLEGAVQGYLTMDTLGALAFGIVIVAAVRRYGVSDHRLVVRHAIQAALIAGAGLSLVYLGLFYLGGMSQGLVTDATHGGQILAYMVTHLLGPMGKVALSLVITLACLTTAVGVTTSCGDYFHHRWPRISYRFWVSILCLASMVVANIGLETLLKLSIPVVITLYPVAIMVVVAGILRNWITLSRGSMQAALLVIILFSSIDGLNAVGFLKGIEMTDHIPLFDNGLGWLLPGLSVLVFGWLIRSVAELKKRGNVES
ncbi:branched-chain amino acid transport system II carrier protein [Sansalvadorimonas sp. 2012CJ34-2]|uniref:Branched-chain amino acid transport system carrier protein n=1 Tax=Parendozoicomonas callyspongiae TaxID=2942213 RepID=A0ABT0PFB8_9GAMM|nr:branched-chain amino acid transport system II carrier protein [Sansalvadorimonas sp. 2012CJ34-2]MCL6270080.1 branched-chain amino acid transport system II carrier protein [Sansalvadorimonas sp. 2012CJ34-2]